MRAKIAVLALAAVGAAVLASTGAMALRLHDDVYYYSGVTPGFGYTPSHHFRRWAYAGPVDSCARRFRSYDPWTGTYVGYDGVRHPCP